MLTCISVLQMSITAFNIVRFFALWFNLYNLNQQMHTFLLKSQYYNTPSLTCFRLHWPIIRDHTVVQNSCLREHSFVQNCCLTLSNSFVQFFAP
jgi:hypothetical protein